MSGTGACRMCLACPHCVAAPAAAAATSSPPEEQHSSSDPSQRIRMMGGGSAMLPRGWPLGGTTTVTPITPAGGTEGIAGGPATRGDTGEPWASHPAQHKPTYTFFLLPSLRHFLLYKILLFTPFSSSLLSSLSPSSSFCVLRWFTRTPTLQEHFRNTFGNTAQFFSCFYLSLLPFLSSFPFPLFPFSTQPRNFLRHLLRCVLNVLVRFLVQFVQRTRTANLQGKTLIYACICITIFSFLFPFFAPDA